MSVDEAREEYIEAVEVERFAARQRREATAVLLHELGVPARHSTLLTTSERSLTWLANVDAFGQSEHLPPSQRRKLRELRLLKGPKQNA